MDLPSVSGLFVAAVEDVKNSVVDNSGEMTVGADDKTTKWVGVGKLAYANIVAVDGGCVKDTLEIGLVAAH